MRLTWWLLLPWMGCSILTLAPQVDCGNGFIEGDEECDDANDASGDGCDNNCRAEVPCGDVIVDPGEECDDGNTTNGDGCDNNCTNTTCGNLIVTTPEECDDGNSVDEDGCTNNCTTPRIEQVAAGGEHTCILSEFGQLRCWGRADKGQLGYGDLNIIGDDEFPFVAGDIAISQPVLIVTGGEHTCAQVASPSGVVCWGRNEKGQLGQGNNDDFGNSTGETPDALANIINLGAVSKVVAGRSHTCAVSNSNEVRCWGEGGDGQLGYGNNNDLNQPTNQTVTLNGGNVLQVAVGGSHSCVLFSGGSFSCWGKNDSGQLGNNNETSNNAPNEIAAAGLDQLTAGDTHTCGMAFNSFVKCWGNGAGGKLGYGNQLNVNTPNTEVQLSDPPIQIAAGNAHTCALLAGGTVQCWGNGNVGSLGYGDQDNIGDNEAPASAGVVNLGSAVVTQITAGAEHTCALLETGKIFCWGKAASGRLGYSGNDENEHIGDDEDPVSKGPVRVF